MRSLFRQFSTPGGVPSHVGPPTPGSIHEGGELGYVLSHAFGATFDNPDLLAVAVVGDGAAETGLLEGSWKGVSFLNPVRDGARIWYPCFREVTPTEARCGNAADDDCDGRTDEDRETVWVVELALGVHTCARMNDRTLSCGGHNDNGQLGNGSTTNRRMPRPVMW